MALARVYFKKLPATKQKQGKDWPHELAKFAKPSEIKADCSFKVF